MRVKYFTDAGIECTPEECKLIESLNRLAKKWEKDGKRWLTSDNRVYGVLKSDAPCECIGDCP